MEYVGGGFIIIVLIISFWLSTFKCPATSEDKAKLIKLAEGCEEAEVYVRKILLRPNLQGRHCDRAAFEVGLLVQEMKQQEVEVKSKRVVDEFIASSSAN